MRFIGFFTSNKLKQFSFIIILLFAFLGLTFVVNVAHEKSHEFDLKNYVNEGSICLLVMPENITDLFSKKLFSQAIAEYDFTYNKSDKEAVDNILDHTERRAYGIEIGIFIIFGFFICITIWHWFKPKEFEF